MADFSQAFTNAATGVGIGSAGGVPGMVAGGALGFLSGLTGFGGDTEDEVMNYERYTPEQREYMKKIRDAAEGGNLEAIEFLKKIVSQDPEAFKDFERPYMEQFEQQTVLELATSLVAASSIDRLLTSNSTFKALILVLDIITT